MQRIQYHSYGGPEKMRLERFDCPHPGNGQITVRVQAASVNPIDWKLRRGELKMMTGRRFPRGMGADFSGTVTAVGERVTRFRVGDAVFGIASLKGAGSFAEAVIVDENFAAIRPAGLSVEQAACLPTAAVTAWVGLIDKAGLKAGQRVFVNGCTGSVGQAVVQIAKLRGAQVAGSCSAASGRMAEALDVNPILDYRTADLAKLAGSFDVVYDTSGALDVGAGLALLKRGGALLDIHATPTKFLRALLDKRLKLFFCTPTGPMLEAIAEAAAAGRMQMPVGKTVRLDEAMDLLTALEGGEKIGGKGLIVI